MSKSNPLTPEALALLGPERLAALLLDAAEHDAPLARTLRIAVASRDGADAAAVEIDAEIKRLKRGRGFIGRDRTRAFARDLCALCTAIEGPLADADPVMALERMFDFIDLAPSLIERSEDRDGHIGETIRWACSSAAEVAARATPALPSERAAFRAFQTYLGDDYGVADRIIADFARALDGPAARRKGAAGRDPASAQNDRLYPRQCPVEPLRPCCSAPQKLHLARAASRRLARAPSARRLRDRSAPSSRPQARVLEPARQR
jgi:hypothetical protein